MKPRFILVLRTSRYADLFRLLDHGHSSITFRSGKLHVVLLSDGSPWSLVTTLIDRVFAHFINKSTMLWLLSAKQSASVCFATRCEVCLRLSFQWTSAGGKLITRKLFIAVHRLATASVFESLDSGLNWTQMADEWREERMKSASDSSHKTNAYWE